MRRHLSFLAIALLAACSHKPPDAAPIASWSATLQLTAEKWLTNSVPTAFVRATIDAATKEFEKTASQPEVPQPIKQQLDALQAASGDFKQAIEKNDRRTVAACARRFAAANSALQQLEDQQQ